MPLKLVSVCRGKCAVRKGVAIMEDLIYAGLLPDGPHPRYSGETQTCLERSVSSLARWSFQASDERLTCRRSSIDFTDKNPKK